MIYKSETKGEYLFFVSCANWTCVIPAKSSIDAATEAIHEAREQLGLEMYLDATMSTVNLSMMNLDFDIDNNYEIHYTPEMLSNAGLHNSAKKLKTIIDLNADDE